MKPVSKYQFGHGRAASIAALILLLLSLTTGVSLREVVTGQPASRPLVSAVDAVGITVNDLDRSVAFFRDVLSFEKLSVTEVAGDEYEHLVGVFGVRMRVARMKLGSEMIELIEYLTPKGRPVPIDSRSNDRWFQHIAIITSDMEEAYQWLRRHKVEHVSTGPQRLPDWNPNAGGIKAFYFKDPDGHPLEILQFPEGKGDPKWHRLAMEDTSRIFLGIDHTAIVVSDTDASLKFYRDVLGLRVAGESENHGIEQERLNNVFGARLRITALKAGSGPGIEFLEYLEPHDGRPAPDDKKSNDLIDWQTSLRTEKLDDAAKTLRSRNYSNVSSAITTMPDSHKVFRRGLLVRDADAHSIRLIEE
ncbi:MAG: VOC family protein [Acidobacteria bacterium]|nr:VOC family protein [Acidobacteriota bacterium]